MFDTMVRAQRVETRALARQDVTARAVVGASDYAMNVEWWRYLVGAGAAYHGYMRNKSVLWAIGWYVGGFLFPLITVPVAVAQMVIAKGHGSGK